MVVRGVPSRLTTSRLLAVGVGVVITLTACGGDAPAADPAPAAGAAPASTDVPFSPTAAMPRVVTSPTAVTPDGAALVQSALDALGSQYHFATTVEVGNDTVLTAQGDRLDSGTRFAVVQGGSTAQYVILANGTYVKVGSAAWQQLDTAPAATDPLAALRSATAAQVTADDGQSTTVTLAVPASTLGVGTTGDAQVEVVLQGGSVQEVRYRATMGTDQAIVRSSFTGVVDPSPVTAPI